MYEAFYGLNEPPFRLTPDPHYLYLSRNHREALGHLLFGIREGTGFIAITGGIGTGKTTLVRALLRDLETNTVVGYIFNPALSDLELLQVINGEFSIPASSNSKKDLVDELNRFLMSQKLAGKRVVVIVDEAQNLPAATLEQLRLLSNLETETTKLLQIVLVGQPELKLLLRRPELAQLNQRISVRWHLEPLDRTEAARYVSHRLRIAGGPAAAHIFSPGALRLLYRYSGGVPRLLNIGAHHALLAGYTQEQRVIDPALMRHAITELRADHTGMSARRRRTLRLAVAAAAALVAGAVTALLLRPPPRPRAAGIVAVQPTMLSPAAAPDAHATPEAAAAAAVEPPQPLAKATITFAPDDGGSSPGRSAVLPGKPQPVAAKTAPALSSSAAESPMAFWAALAEVDHHTAAATATANLLAAWGVEPLNREELSSPRLDLPSIAGRRGLQYLSASGTLSRLLILNLPAILELSLPDSGQRRFAMLSAITGSQVIVRSGKRETVLSRQDIDRVWLGDAHLFWRDFEGFSSRLIPGYHGPEVERLQHMLARVGVYPERPSLAYDAATSEAVARFQRSHRLAPDGIVGPLTTIVLYGALADYAYPRLSEGT
ncbi:MAG: AAA family ATPase [Myxococcales bacterium]|nr:AAA family ATPase [Myxococcales bacterium]